ncbi:MAG: dicarboxylate/amino acid:cation symporter [Sphingobacteriales bacterium]|nr:MAG: dicarboxylate/amino acid:cation symporter [Sphingobacteriales bacterium]
MAGHPSPSGKNRITLYIIIALVLGIALGTILNTVWLDGENKSITALQQQQQATELQLRSLPDTLLPVYSATKADLRDIQNDLRANQDAIEAKTGPFLLLAELFLRLIKMIVAPLVFSTLVVGVARLGDIRSVGRIGGKTLLWFLGASILSLLLGMVLVNLFQPGSQLHLALPPTDAATGVTATALNLKDFLFHTVPSSVVDAMAKNEILQIVIFAILFGVATSAIGEKGELVISFFDSVSHVILKMTGYIMNAAPVAVFGAMVAIIARQGPSILKTYSVFIGEFYLSLGLLWLVLIGIGFLVIGKRVFTLMRRIREPALLAFSTASSEAAFPQTLTELERFGCPPKIASFVLPLGYSFNLDGSMMYMTFATLFIAQSYGIHLPIGTQLSMLAVLLLTSKGIAGVPRASLVVIAGTLATFKIPEAGLALLLGIDPLLDMGRSATNVVGNSIATAAVTRWEKMDETA